MVISRGAFLAGDLALVQDEIAAVRDACGKTTLKVILETSELETYDNIRAASFLAMRVLRPGDFIKTSTGKTSSNATLGNNQVMLEAIRDFYLETGTEIAMKPAGGIRTAKQALHFLVAVKETLGDAWLTPARYRFGASALLNDLVRQLEKEGKVVQVKVNGFNRGGVTCELEGLRGFIPRSQLQEGENHEALVGKTLGVAFLEVNPETRKLVLSEKKAATAALFQNLEVGQLVEGQVVSIKPYGLFIDLGGVSGLLHQSAITGGQLVFSFAGILVASVLVNLPLMVQPAQRAFEAVGDDLRAAVKQHKQEPDTGHDVDQPGDRGLTYHSLDLGIHPLVDQGFIASGLIIL